MENNREKIPTINPATEARRREAQKCRDNINAIYPGVIIAFMAGTASLVYNRTNNLVKEEDPKPNTPKEITDIPNLPKYLGRPAQKSSNPGSLIGKYHTSEKPPKQQLSEQQDSNYLDSPPNLGLYDPYNSVIVAPAIVFVGALLAIFIKNKLNKNN